MREIKFRAWLKKENKMVEVKSLHLGTQKIMYGYSNNSQSYGNRTTPLQDCILMQYTGLKDKNDKYIYEGDIVKSGNLTGIAEFNTENMGSCGCCWSEFFGVGFVIRVEGRKEEFFGAMEIDRCEVVGNIYENRD